MLSCICIRGGQQYIASCVGNSPLRLGSDVPAGGEPKTRAEVLDTAKALRDDAVVPLGVKVPGAVLIPDEAVDFGVQDGVWKAAAFLSCCVHQGPLIYGL